MQIEAIYMILYFLLSLNIKQLQILRDRRNTTFLFFISNYYNQVSLLYLRVIANTNRILNLKCIYCINVGINSDKEGIRKPLTTDAISVFWGLGLAGFSGKSRRSVLLVV
jgi:hypothetical protein